MDQSNFKVFVVDDDQFTLSWYAQYIGNLGSYDVTSFDNSLACLNNLTQEPNIIFLDHRMDNLSGLEVLRKIKRFNPNIYVVFISGQEDIQVAVNALKLGAFDYIIKGEGDLQKIADVLKRISDIQNLLQNRSGGFFSRILSLM
jgi:DNA-binding NtrC family response regulator